ncbi:MAG TPA: hypothetical protein DCE78_08850 [Bacteroidetes bacterium]|nr:hypothetical protein [Bacteroidota bacterium]
MLPIAFINHIQCSEWPAVVKRIAHEIQRPSLIDINRANQRLGWAGENPLLGSALHVQPHFAVHPMHALMVKTVSIEPNPIKAFPKALARTLGNDIINGINHLAVSCQSIHFWPV